jgi:DNA-directed RNA polymerase specialized sigma24 family protein
MTPELYGESYRAGFEGTIRFLRSRGAPSRDSAEEAAQAAWARGWERRHQLRDDHLVVSWVNMIALNVFRGGLRRCGPDASNHEELPELAGPGEANLAAIDAAKVLQLCRPRERALFEQQMNGLTTEEIARDQGVTRTAIRIRFLRARRDARSRMEQRAMELRESHAVAAAG